MSGPIRILRARRRRHRRSRPARNLKRTALAGLAFVAVAASGLAIYAASTMDRITGDLPTAGELQGLFGIRGAESYRPPVVYDRSGEVAMFALQHPLTTERRWLELTQGGANSIPEHLVQATLAALDPGFWTNPGYELESLVSSLVNAGNGDPGTITQRLVETSLLPPSRGESSMALREVRTALLAAELTSQQPKERILTWFLNSAHYGMWAHGVDAAALVYFGKHAQELTLAESALIASLPEHPDLNPIQDPAAAAELQQETLQAMVAQGYISEDQAEQSQGQRVTIQTVPALREWRKPDYADALLAQLAELIGEPAVHRSGLRVITTLDHDLSLQSACAAASHVVRLGGDAPGSIVEPEANTPCLAAGLLPPLRPGDSALDHNVDSWSLAVLDPRTGELLAVHGDFARAAPASPLIVPFIYLTSLSRGSSPGTMVLDIPGAELAASDLSLPLEGSYRGPVSLRSALANLYPGAAALTLESLGTPAVLRTLQQMGIEALPAPVLGADEGRQELGASLLELSAAFGIIANGGRAAGGSMSDEPGLSDSALRPSLVLSVVDARNRILYTLRSTQQPILSPQLAFLMADMLSDESARWPSLGQSNLLEINRPAGAILGHAAAGSMHWTVGFTPSRIVGVWISSPEGENLQSIGSQNGSTAIWSSVMRYAASDLPPEGWEPPPGVSALLVCEPSGLLPTQYCPQVVEEFFVHGTEPTHYDGLYRPFRINRETGKLATLFTPLEKIEERIYMVVPPEAQDWAQQAGIERPPEAYDPVLGSVEGDSQVNLTSPAPFGSVGGLISIRGVAAPERFAYYRLHYGQGLNPSRWVQIGEDRSVRVPSGILGSWDTQLLNGLYTLQLMVVLEDGQVRTASTPLTIDNTPPELRLLSPQPGEVLRLSGGEAISLQAEAFDDIGLDRVEFYADGRRVALVREPPYTANWSPGSLSGEAELTVLAYDLAGNWTEIQPVTVRISR